jgi:transcriptional regulator with XRE-family HTH domain
MSTKDRIRYRLVELMDEHGTRGVDLADRLGVKKQTVSCWRTGAASLSIDNLIGVCDYYNITLDDFVGRDDGGNPEKKNENYIIMMYRLLDADGKAAVISMLERMTR